MKLKINDKFSFPAASLAIFEIVTVLVLIPLIDRVVYPGLRRVGFNFTPLRRIGVGLIFAAGSVALAGFIEIERKKKFGRVTQIVFNRTVHASNMSVFYQVPQYILQGTSEALVSTTGVCKINWVALDFFFHLNIINHNNYNLIHSFLSRCGLHLFYCILLVIVKGLRSTCYITLWSMVSALTSVISRENKKYDQLYRAY